MSRRCGRREVLDRYTMDVVLDHWLEAIDDVGAGPGLLGRVGRRIGG